MSTVAGVDIGGTKLFGVAVAPARPDVAVADQRIESPASAGAMLDAIVELVERLEDAAGPVAAVGVGIAGLVDRDGVLRTSPNLGGLVDVALRDELAERLGRPVVVDNDATVAAAAEAELGAGKDASPVVLVTLGTGIGGGIHDDGALQRGAHGFAGEFGHMIVDPAGPRCPCGRRGCWERFASGSGLGRLAREAAHAGALASVVGRGIDPEDVRGEEVVAAARDGQADARAVLDEFAWWVALGVANLTSALDPAVVVLGGGVADDAELFIDQVRTHTAAFMAGDGRPPVRIEVARFGGRSGAIGAALLAGAALDAD